ncbi:MAG: DUF4013 domain-containing protein [Methanobacteriaceae archaeon]|nr:DUF4013 domain-containing protein [Methanobacteriaceae archaeon]MDP2837077.1 DUF4013 domain-containing protein [Methanobacteriaceae archaeon]MDP3034050.1 DUF4013 domain-containing protein [Methanobacteriaceae archaeon]MDP3484485.1 DUF4013 domain-containing protein [Methanobacteriaceae archaeon]MDP3624467.1 DUF4013 domain-containing protein [Methanobacteriaceae archaeon]
MSIKELFLDASKFAASDWTKFILLGIIFVDIDLLDQTTDMLMPDFFNYIFLVAFFILVFIEAGYLFRIIESSVDGSDKLPPFSNLLQLFAHGLKDSLVVGSYMFIPAVLFVISAGLALIYLGNDISVKFPLEILLLSLVTGIVFFIILQAAILNMAHNKGKLKSAFDYSGIFRKIKNVGLKKFVVVCFLTAIIFVILKPFVVDELRGYMDPIGSTIMEIIIAPYLAILTSRFLGTMDRYN